LVDRAQTIDAQIEEIERTKNSIHPCQYCVYQ